MTETEFTPPRWRIAKCLASNGHVKNYMIVPSQPCGLVCDIAREPACPPDEQLANAHLIAAAPELYGALEDVAETLRSIMLYPEVGFLHESVAETLEGIEGILARARGEENEK